MHQGDLHPLATWSWRTPVFRLPSTGSSLPWPPISQSQTSSMALPVAGLGYASWELGEP